MLQEKVLSTSYHYFGIYNINWFILIAPNTQGTAIKIYLTLYYYFIIISYSVLINYSRI